MDLFLRINSHHIHRVLHQPLPPGIIKMIIISQQLHIVIGKSQLEILHFLKLIVRNRQLNRCHSKSSGNARKFGFVRAVTLLQLSAVSFISFESNLPSLLRLSTSCMTWICRFSMC